MITYNNKDILKFFIGNNRIVKKYLNNKVVYGTPDFAQYYNIQGYDNYEVIGNLTIVDGVVSNFSRDDYILVANSFAPTGAWEIVIKTKTPNGNASKYFIGGGGYNLAIGTTDTPANHFKAFFSSNGTSWNIGNITSSLAISNDVWYYVRVGFNGTEYYMDYSTDGENYIDRVTKSSTAKLYASSFLLGQTMLFPKFFWSGQIDLKETYIKVNGQYWFNGNSNYKELLDCNPNVYLQSSGTQYIDTDISGVASAELDAKGILDNLVSQIVLGKYSSGPNFFGQFGTSKKWGIGSDRLSDLPYTNRGKFLVNFNSNGISFTYNGITYDRSTGSVQLDRNIFIFACNAAAKYYASANVYSLKIYNSNNELIRNFVPVPQGLQIGSYKVPLNGMFDIVEQKFYENEGSGEFIWGVDL